MSLSDLAAIGGFISGIAVVASLVFVGIQMLQSNRTQNANSLQSLWDGFRQRTFRDGYLDGEYNQIWAQGLTSFDGLDENGKRRFFYMMGEALFVA